MKKRIALVLTLVFAVLMTASCAPPPAAKTDQAEVAQFRSFIQEHPHALQELQANPAAIGTPEFAKQFRGVGQYLADHPQIINYVKAHPDFFKGLQATSSGGSHHLF